MVKPVIEPVVKPVIEPVVKPVTKPVVEPVVEPVTEPVVEPVVEPVTEPVIDPVVTTLKVAITKLLKNLKTKKDVETLQRLVGQLNETIATKQVDPVKIGYVYDWESIFANPAQEKLFAGAYDSRNMVKDDVNAELIKMLRS